MDRCVRATNRDDVDEAADWVLRGSETTVPERRVEAMGPRVGC
jgi:hypothetical protein